MPETITLSEDARSLLELHLDGRSLRVGVVDPESLPGRTPEETRVAYRELVTAGLMDALHSFAWGRDSRYRLTEAGYRWACALREAC